MDIFIKSFNEFVFEASEPWKRPKYLQIAENVFDDLSELNTSDETKIINKIRELCADAYNLNKTETSWVVKKLSGPDYFDFE